MNALKAIEIRQNKKMICYIFKKNRILNELVVIKRRIKGVDSRDLSCTIHRADLEKHLKSSKIATSDWKNVSKQLVKRKTKNKRESLRPVPDVFLCSSKFTSNKSLVRLKIYQKKKILPKDFIKIYKCVLITMKVRVALIKHLENYFLFVLV
ncbi:hypothetical protein BpHYR1_031299 [Brachionus plicatilis]|uniref:Uncharacterized protein n=1 Tax=Brachionus plicatilis TaxID=10195 RepID=A0A3M7T6W0_BRAPC|nr:hypothetical protein BpHYR1_031299 [Brachionus plicatilis]